MPAVDDIELVRQLLAVPGPPADVTAAGRARLDALAGRGAEECSPLRRRPGAAGRPRGRAATSICARPDRTAMPRSAT